VIAAKDDTESPLRVFGSGSNLADHRLIEVTGTGELIIAGGTGNGYRLAEFDGRHKSLRMVRCAQSEDARWSHGGLHPAVLQPMVPERTNR